MPTMRTYVVLAVTALAALAVSAAAMGGETVQAGAKQTFDAKLKPSRLPAEDYKGVGLNIEVAGCYVESGTSDCKDPSTLGPGEFGNPDAKRAQFKFPRKNIVFDSTEAKQCKVQGSSDQQAETLANLNPSQAKQACGNGSVIGDGDANALAGQTNIPAEVTVFNGKKKGGKPVILLHAYASNLNVGTVPVGVLKRVGPNFILDVTIDQLLSGQARLQRFQVTVKKDDYVQGSCAKSPIRYQSSWQYYDLPGETIKVNDSHKCTKRG